MIVMTSKRSRDLKLPNVYGMHQSFRDKKTGLYTCLNEEGVFDIVLSQSSSASPKINSVIGKVTSAGPGTTASHPVALA